VYASTCEPLALLEKLVHFAGLRRPAYSLYIADVPDNLIEDLPAASGFLPTAGRKGFSAIPELPRRDLV